MKKLRLNNNEITEVLNLSSVKNKRIKIQDIAYNNILQETKSKKVILSAFPRFGKSYFVLNFIKNLNNKFNSKHLVIAPTTHIVKEFNKLFKEHNITNVVCSTLAGCFTKRFQLNYNNTVWCSIYYDEADYAVSSVNSQKFSKVLNFNSRWKICLSGTFSHENIKLLSSKGFDTLFEISVDDGILLGVLPRFNTYNLSIPLTIQERNQYYQYHILQEKLLLPYTTMFGDIAEYAISSIENNDKLFTLNGVCKTGKEWLQDMLILTGWKDVGILIGRKRQWNETRSKMNDILANSYNKKAVIQDILKKLNNNKGIIFTSRKEICDELQNMNPYIKAYHSDSDDSSILEDFKLNNNIKAIACVDKLTRGFTETGISYAINSTYNSKRNSYIQKISRALSIDENNKEVIIINLYCGEFTVNGKTIITKDYSRLMRAQENDIVEWIESLDDLDNE